MDGILAGALALLLLSVVAGGAVLGVIVSALLFVAHRHGNQTLEFLAGALCLSAATLLATLDLIDLGGNVRWRFACFTAALAVAMLASRSTVRRSTRPGAPTRGASGLALAAAVFAATASSLLGLPVSLIAPPVLTRVGTMSSRSVAPAISGGGGVQRPRRRRGAFGDAANP
jgi:uncharacterized membrane protein